MSHRSPESPAMGGPAQGLKPAAPEQDISCVSCSSYKLCMQPHTGSHWVSRTLGQGSAWIPGPCKQGLECLYYMKADGPLCAESMSLCLYFPSLPAGTTSMALHIILNFCSSDLSPYSGIWDPEAGGSTCPYSAIGVPKPSCLQLTTTESGPRQSAVG